MKRAILLIVVLAASLSFAEQGLIVPRILQAGSRPAGMAVNLSGRLSANAPYLNSILTSNPVASPALPGPPVITSSAATNFTVGSPGSFIVTSIGNPVPGMTVWGVLPTGVTFTDNGNGTATLAGTPGVGTEGVYSIYITAANGYLPNAIQAFTLMVSPAPPAPPTITSDNNTTFTIGSYGSFTVTTTGSPIPTLTRTGALPSGVTFTDNGNGTATLAGTPAVGSQGSYPFIIRATNGLSPDAIQAFALKVKSVPAIIVIPELDFAYSIGGTVPPAQSLGITSSGTDLSYTVSADQTWLSVSPASGTTPGNISVTINPAGLAANVYHGTVTITAPGAENSPIPVAVVLTVTPGPQIIIGPTVLPFSYVIGGSIPAPRTIGVTSSGAELKYTVTTDHTWLIANPTSNTTPSNVTISIDPSGLGVGNYQGTVSIASAVASNSPQTATVNLSVTNTGPLTLNPTSLSYTYTIGDSVPAPQSVNLTSSGSPLNYTVASNASWLSSTPTSGTTPGSISVSVDPTGLQEGTYQSTLTITAPDASNSPLNLPVTFNVKNANTTPFVMGFDMRDTQSYVTDVAPNTYVLGANTLYPTTRGGATFGWTDSVAYSFDRSKYGDPRLAGVNLVRNDIPPGVFRIDLPSPGTYTISLAMGDQYYSQCWTGCRIEFKDGATSLFILNYRVIEGGTFLDANGLIWTAEEWPANNTTRDVTIAGTTLTVLVGANNYGFGTQTPVAFIGLKRSQSSNSPDFTVSAAPSTLPIPQNGTATTTISTTVLQGFNDQITLSASGLPDGITASFSPNPIPGPGYGNSTLTFTASHAMFQSATVTITATGGGITHTTTVTLNGPPKFAIGFDMRSTSPFVDDVTPNTYVLGTSTLYPTVRNGVTFGWLSPVSTGADRTKSSDPRLAGTNMVANSISPGAFRVDLPEPGTYNVTLALGDGFFGQCWTGCRVEFKDGNNTLFVLTPGAIPGGSFIDSNGKVWTAADWPARNTARQVTLSGSSLTVLVGANNNGFSSFTPVAFIGVEH